MVGGIVMALGSLTRRPPASVVSLVNLYDGRGRTASLDAYERISALLLRGPAEFKDELRVAFEKAGPDADALRPGTADMLDAVGESGKPSIVVSMCSQSDVSQYLERHSMTAVSVVNDASCLADSVSDWKALCGMDRCAPILSLVATVDDVLESQKMAARATLGISECARQQVLLKSAGASAVFRTPSDLMTCRHPR